MTPREFHLWAGAFRERQRAGRRERRAEIYSLAALIRSMVWAKHPPDFERVFPEERQKAEMSEQQMLRQVMAQNAAFGGRITQRRD